MPSGEGNGNPLPRLQSTGLLRVGHDWATSLSLFTFTFHFHALEKEMATHSSVLAWRILGTGEPGGLPSMGYHTVRHDWSNLAVAAASSSTGVFIRGKTRDWWWTGRPGMLQFMGSQRVGHDWATELNWTPFIKKSQHKQN